jgi:long-subunit fatty acid transport protein
MKKTGLILLFSIAVFVMSSAQNIDDALRYSQVFYSGTARFMSMGGAFTALGGDISTLSQNPAGLGVFRSSELTVTPQLFHFSAKAGFNGTTSKDYLYNFNLAQIGLVANIINRNQETGLITLNFGYSFNRTNNLNQNIMVESNNNSSSLADYWADISNGYYKDELSANVPDAFLAWDTWLIDTLSGANTQYGTVYSNYGDNPPSVYGQNMRRLITNTGYTGEHAFSIGGNYSNKFYFGATFGVTMLNYESKYEHLESTSDVLPSSFSKFNYTFYYNNSGTGYTFKVGAIYKPIESLRIGFAFHSPTVFRIDEQVNDKISTYFTDRAEPYTSDNGTSRYNYSLTTPFRVLTGVALQIKKLALLSADYEFVDYRTAKFSETGDGYDYGQKNLDIKNGLRSTSNLRLGAEVRLSNIYLRGGYGYYGKAFAKGDLNDNLCYNSLSCGIGFREQNVFADFGFTSIMNSQNYILYDSSAGSAVSDMNLIRNMFAITIGYKFGY